MFPAVFALLKNKKQRTYENLFKLLQIMIPNLHPQTIKTDFEFAIIAALKNSFREVRVSGCQFHLGQALIRKLQDERLFVFYKTNYVFKKFVKALISLSYVKLDELINYFNELLKMPDFPQQLISIYNYFFNNFIGNNFNARIPPTIWHCSHMIEANLPRTNNAIEGWHHVFNETFIGVRFSSALLFQKLKDEEVLLGLKC